MASPWCHTACPPTWQEVLRPSDVLYGLRFCSHVVTAPATRPTGALRSREVQLLLSPISRETWTFISVFISI